MDDDLKEMLHRRAADADVEPGMPAALRRRARGRRALNAAVAGLTAVVVVGGVAIGVQVALRHGPAPAHHGQISPPPRTRGTGEAGFPGIWPESSRADLVAAQGRVDGGADPWRLGSESTAREFAIRVMGWVPAENRLSTRVLSPSREQIDVWDLVVNKEAGLPLTDGSLGTVITLQQLGRTGPRGIWSVTHLRSRLFTLDVGPQGADGCPTAPLTGGKPAGMCGRVLVPAVGNFVSWKVYVGPHPDIVQGEGNLLGGAFAVTGGQFGGGLTEKFPKEASLLVVRLVDRPSGRVSGIEALRLDLRRR
jgi:hypothetical protein